MVNRQSPCAVAVIGDVVASRQHDDRSALHQRLSAALAGPRLTSVLTAARITVGDEFQVGLSSLPEALGLVWDLRVQLLPRIDVRFGIGLGDIQVLDVRAGVEDGSAWWAARRAIEEVKELAKRPAHRHRRVRVSAWHQEHSETGRVADGGVAAVDTLFAGLDDKDPVLLRALRTGMTQAQAGEQVGINQQSVSERVSSHGLGALLTVREAWGIGEDCQ